MSRDILSYPLSFGYRNIHLCQICVVIKIETLYYSTMSLSIWSRRESNSCPKASPLSFYYHSQLFDIPSGRRQLTAFCLQ